MKSPDHFFLLFLLCLMVLFSGLIALLKFHPISPTPPTSQTNTVWKTYTDDIVGFSIKYPSTWNEGSEKGVDGNILVLTPVPMEQIGQQIQAVYIQVHNNPKHLSSSTYYHQVIKPGQTGSVCIHPLINTNIPSSLKNLDITIIEGLCGVLPAGPRMVVTNAGHIIDISSSFTDKVDNYLIYQVLSTFKFTK